mmetsp:Transcript_68393/g.198260  ORF Transcript_68393/g.198260 Transcript_68393/m.198260 type:complete len:223 (+) Transcript_68393:809-1477(+)
MPTVTSATTSFPSVFMVLIVFRKPCKPTSGPRRTKRMLRNQRCMSVRTFVNSGIFFQSINLSIMRIRTAKRFGSSAWMNLATLYAHRQSKISCIDTPLIWSEAKYIASVSRRWFSKASGTRIDGEQFAAADRNCRSDCKSMPRFSLLDFDAELPPPPWCGALRQGPDLGKAESPTALSWRSEAPPRPVDGGAADEAQRKGVGAKPRPRARPTQRDRMAPIST